MDTVNVRQIYIYISAIKEKQILTFVTTLVDPELIETESRTVVARGQGMEEMERRLSNGTNFQL